MLWLNHDDISDTGMLAFVGAIKQTRRKPNKKLANLKLLTLYDNSIGNEGMTV